MNKIPVGRSIAHAYGFLFGRIFTVIGLSWVGALLYAVLSLVAIQKMPGMEAMHAAVLAGHPQAALLHVAIVLAAVLIIASVAIPLTTAALGKHEGLFAAHFVIGGPELRYFLALIRLYVLIAVLAVAGGLAALKVPLLVKMAAAQWPQLPLGQYPVEQGLQIGTAAIAALVVLVLLLRFGFLLKAVAAAEPHASLLRAWSLSRGSTLRILIVLVVVAIPAYAVIAGCEYALLGQPVLDATRDALAAWPARPDSVLKLVTGNSLAFAGLAALKLFLLVSLMAGASAAAYRGVTEADERSGEDDEAEPAAAAHGHGDHGHGHDEHGHEEHGHEEHGHEDHGHEEHGHEDHGHDEHAHGDHGHEEHGHDDHGHGDHGHGDHGHDDHGHDDHGHGGHHAHIDHGGEQSHGTHAEVKFADVEHTDAELGNVEHGHDDPHDGLGHHAVHHHGDGEERRELEHA